MKTAIEQYRQLVTSIDELAENLTGIHGEHIICAEKCFHCCANISVWPVEFYAIFDAIRSAGITELLFDEDAQCGFLKDGLCTVYAYRPIICRTHGLPIVFLNDEVDPPEYSVSFCDDNFTRIDDAKYEFNSTNTLNIDNLNSELYKINLAFLKENPDKQLNETIRIPLRELMNELKPE